MAEFVFTLLLLACLLLAVYGAVNDRLSYKRWLRHGEKLREMTPADREAAIEEWNERNS